MEKAFSLLNRKWMVCTSISFLGSFIVIFYLKYREQQAGFTSLQGIRPIPSTNLNENSNDKSLTSNVEFSQRSDGVEAISQIPDRVGDNDDETGSGTPITPTLDKVGDDNKMTSGALFSQNKTSSGAAIAQRLDSVFKGGKKSNGAHEECNIFEGRWVYDPATYPLYHAHQCPFLSEGVNCKRNGRPDYDYASWKWEPRGCNFPRFDGKELLERWRGKRVVIVGDSLNRNQWESLACMLFSVLPPGRAYVDVRKSAYWLFQAKDYSFTAEFFQSPYIVLFDKKVVKLNTLPPSAKEWRGADIMVFNSAHWWAHRGSFKRWDFFEHKGKLVENMAAEKAYSIALKTWAKWIDRTVDPVKTTVFFRSSSPVHSRCYNRRQPIYSKKSYAESRLIEILENTLGHMKTPVKYLNITHLSIYRIDAHSSVYRTRQTQRKTSSDCSHWCLPGLPDTWNVLMYISTVFTTSPRIL